MNPVLTTPAFWHPYLTLEPESINGPDLAAQLDSLQRDHVVREVTTNYVFRGQPRSAVHRLVEFPISCGDRFSLMVEYYPDLKGCEKVLYLIDARTGKKWQMGWWDLARCHPYCVRLDELGELFEYWQQSDTRLANPDLALLLICQFVGLADSQELDALNVRSMAACKSLGLPAIGERYQWVPLHAPEGYRWEFDAELGWLFASPTFALR